MKKIVKKYGTSLVIVFNTEDREVYSLKEGDILDLEFRKIQTKKYEQ